MAKRTKRDTDGDVARLAGEVHALVTFAQSLACAVTVNQSVEAHFRVAEQVGLAKIEGLPITDRTIEGYQSVVKAILGAFAKPVKLV